MMIDFPSHAELLENFSLLDDWEERYAYLIDLGKKLPAFPVEQKHDGNLVRGCTSQVWLVEKMTDPGTINFLADSDAHIVRGLIALLYAVYDGQGKDFVKNVDIEAFFARLGLSEHLSPSRRNGFFAMVGRIKNLAA